MPASNGLIPAPGQGLKMPRSVFKRSVPGGASMNYGRIYPVFMKYQEANSHMAFNMKSVIRGATPIAPVMGNAKMEFHAFSVPWRIIWNYTKQFFGENDTSAWTQQNDYQKPQIELRLGTLQIVPHKLITGEMASSDLASTNSTWYGQSVSASPFDFVVVKSGISLSGFNGTSGITDDLVYDLVINALDSDVYGPNKLADYLGIHPIAKDNEDSYLARFWNLQQSKGSQLVLSVDALPFRAFFSIVNYYYRDQNYTDPYLFSKDNETLKLTVNSSEDSTGRLVMPYDFMKYRPLSAHPGSGRAAEIYEGSAFCPPASRLKDPFSTIVPEPLKGESYDLLSIAGLAPVVGVGTAVHAGSTFVFGDGNGVTPNGNQLLGLSNGSVEYGTNSSVSYSGAIGSSNLYADLSNASKITLEKFRDFVVLNQWNEKAVKGTRYAEILNEFYGVPVNPALLDEPRFLGGCSVPIASWQVSQTAPGSDGTGLGDLGAFTHTKNNDGLFVFNFDEPSILMVIAVARVEHTFAQQIDPHWFRKDKFDEHYALFDGLGYQPLDKRIPFLPHGVLADNGDTSDTDTLGFQESYWEERYQLGNVAGVLNASNVMSLDYWMYNELPTEKPLAGPEYISAFRDADIVDRTLQLGSEASRYAQQLICDFSFDYVEAKVISSRMDPGLTRI